MQTGKIAVFCDGSGHDDPDQQKLDQVERDNLKYNTNYSVFVLRHNDDWKSKLEMLASLIR